MMSINTRVELLSHENQLWPIFFGKYFFELGD